MAEASVQVNARAKMLGAGPTLNLGFITVHEDHSGFVGGYLAANRWGRPLEFRLTTPVQPSRVQQILYGGTLKPYVYADLIGKTLVEKSSTEVQLIICDCEPLLDLRLHVQTPVAWLASKNDLLAERWEQAGARSLRTDSGLLLCHPQFDGDTDIVRRLLKNLSDLDLAEPFARVLEALKETRKSGAIAKAA